MNKRLGLIVCSALIFSGLAFSATPSFAQKKTIKACEEEWRANKAANEAAKITEKAYVAKCRADAEKPAAARRHGTRRSGSDNKDGARCDQETYRRPAGRICSGTRLRSGLEG